MDVQNLMGYHGRVAANQFVIMDEDEIIFQSYDSLIAVAKLSQNKVVHVVLGEDWDYSRTTTKYLCKFLADYCDMPGMNKAKIEKAIANGDLGVV